MTNFEVRRYYQNKSLIIGVYSINNSPNVMTETVYVKNLDEHANFGANPAWFYIEDNYLTYFSALVLNIFKKKKEKGKFKVIEMI